MADDSNTFPLVLAIREDGSVDSVVDSFERNIGAATTRAAAGFESIRRSVAALEQQAARRIADPLGLKSAVQALGASPMQKMLTDLSASETALQQQRARESAARIAALNREFDAAMQGIRAQQAARTAAFAQAEREGQALVSLQQQRVQAAFQDVAAPRQVAGVSLDPQGASAAATSARAFAAEQEAVANAAERVAAATNKATLADRNYAIAAREAATAAGQEAARLEGQAATQVRVAAEIDRTTGALRRQIVATGEMATLRRQTLIYTASDVVASLGSGSSPFTILLQQGPQVAQVLALQRGGFKSLLDAITPMRAAIGGLSVATLVGVTAWLSYRNAMGQVQGLAQGVGAAAGLTSGQIVAAANAGAAAAGISAAAARELELAYLSSGNVGEQVLGRLIGITRNYAAATGGDLKKAANDLATAFANPAAGADTLTAKLGILDQAGVRYIQTLVEQNRNTEAQTALLNALGPALEGAASHTTALEQGFRNIGLAASSAFEVIGRLIDRAAGGGALLDQIADLQKQRDLGPSLGQMLTGTSSDAFRKQKQGEIDALRYQLRQEQARAERAQANSRAQSTGALVDKFTGNDALSKLKQQQAQVRATLNDPLQGMPAAQRRDTLNYYNAVTRAVQTYIPEQRKQVRLAQLDAQIAAASSPAQKAALAAKREQLNLAGRVITAADADAIAVANGARANIAATRSADSHAAALRRRNEAFAQAQTNDLDKVQRIGERFDEQPKLVDQSKSAIRDLDELIRKYGELNDAKSKSIVESARLARVAAENAPATQIGLATAELRDQLPITRLIAEGRQAEAAALQDKLSLLKRIGIEIGKETPGQAGAIAEYDAARRTSDQADFDARFANDQRAAEREQEAIRAEIAGRQDIADLIRARNGYESEGQRLSADQRQILADRLATEQALTRENERRVAIVNAQVDAARRMQDAFTSFFEKPFAKGSLKDLGDALTQSRQRQIAETLSIKLFGGDLGSRVYDALTRGSAPLNVAGTALQKSAADLTAAAGAFRSAADNNPSIAQLSTTPTAFPTALIPALVGNLAPMENEIVVNGKREEIRGVSGTLGPGGSLELVATGFDKVLAQEKRKIQVQQGVTTALSFAAQAIGGKGGRVINAGLNILQYREAGKDIAKNIGGPLGEKIGGAVKGLGIGQAVASVFDLVGIRGGSTGAKIGGTIGGLTGNPLIAAGASVIGGLIGAAFFKPKFGTASVSGNANGSSVQIGGNSSSARSGAGSLGEAVQNGVQSIADQLGGILGNYAVSIGTFDGKYRVSTTGFTGSLDSKKAKGQGLNDFGTDGQEAAIRFAIADAIRDGAVQGLRAGTQRLISLGTDIDRQLAKALQFEGVFRELKALKDPIGAATDEIDKQIAALRKVFDEAGASSEERAQLEELYALKRTEAIKQAQEQVNGQLRAFLDDLRYKGDSGLSLRTREATAMSALAPLIAQIQAGKSVDQGAFTEASRSYLDISRQIYGSTNAYFEKLAQIMDLTGRAIYNTGASNVTPITAAVQQAAQAAYAAVQPSTASGTAYSGGSALAIPSDRAAMFTAGQMTDVMRAAFPATSAAAVAAMTTPVDTASIVAATREATAAINAMKSEIGQRVDLLTRVTSEMRGRFELQIADGGSAFPRVAALRNA